LAQSIAPPQKTDGFQLFPRYDFHLTAEHLSHDDPRYVWDMNYGGELDLFGYRSTRLTFVANYQAGLGEEFHPFDPNQGNYTIDGVLSTRVKGFYVAGVFHHLSRHLADRPKRPPVDWNMFGGRVGAVFNRNGTDVEARVDLLGAILKTNVDYNWEMHAGLRVHHHVYGTFGLIGSATLREITTNGLGNRGTQTGGRLEAGVRLNGRGAAIELFIGIERRLDADPIDRLPKRWTVAGFRLLSR